MHHKTIFISDLHLGSRGAQAEVLLDFLANNTCDELYLIGDIIDFWALKRKSFFPISHMAVIQKLLDLALTGTKIYYAPGNHDEDIRKFIPFKLDNISVANEFVHTTADGRKLLIIHGDCYDQVVKYARWLAWLGDIGYAALLRSNTVVNAVRRRLGYKIHWSLSAYVKLRVKSAVNFIGEYEEAVAHSVRDRGLDGVVCGHIHHAEVRSMGGITYMNDGDWVETCSALVERENGHLGLVYWYLGKAADIAAAA